MKFGLAGINIGLCADPGTAAAIARAAEAAGFDSVWTGEHLVLPDPPLPPMNMAPTTLFADTVVMLSYLAAQTRTIRLASGIILLPQRNPVVLAKELASLDVVSGGRLIFGIGIGSIKPEFDAIGVPFEHKGARSDEYLRAMIALWTMEQPEFHGRFVSFSGVNAMPRPVQKPYPEVVFGGHSVQAYRRVARLGKGWYGYALDLERAKSCIDGLRQACQQEGRRFEEIEISVAAGLRLTPDLAKRFADLGVHRMIVTSRASSRTGLEELISGAERELIGKI